MNINKLSKQKHLEEKYMVVAWNVAQSVLNKQYLSGKIISSRLNDDGNPVFGVDVVEMINDKLTPKRLEYIVVNDKIYPTLPLTPLCDTQG